MKLEKKQPSENLSTNTSKDAGAFSEDKYQQISFGDKEINKDTPRSQKKQVNKNEGLEEAEKVSSIQLEIEENPVKEKEKLEEVEEAVKKQSTKKKKWTNLIFLFINLGVVAGILTHQILNEDGFTSLAEISSKINWALVVLLIVVFFIIMILEALKFWLLIYRTTGKSRFGLSYRMAALGKYYDNITPFASGEQPFQVFYLNKHGVPGAESLSIPMAKYVFWQISFIIFTFIIMMSSLSIGTFDNAGSAIVSAGSWIGFSINLALVLLIGTVSISKKVGTKIVEGMLKLLHKIKIVKNYDKQYNKIMELVDDYQTTMRKYAKDGWVFALMIIITFGGFLLHFSLPFLIHAVFFGFNWGIFASVFIYCVMIDLAAGFLPLPGGTGAAELSFTALFGIYFIDGTIFWAMLIWRIFTFYGPIIQGLVIILYDYLIGNKRFQWEKKKWALEEESRTFEENHLRDFEASLNKSKQKKNKRSRKI